MTLEEAKEAHKNGFPDIFNGWARYGAYKQYANNSVDNFIQDFKMTIGLKEIKKVIIGKIIIMKQVEFFRR